MWKRWLASSGSRSPFVLMPLLLLMWGSLAAVSKLLLGNLDSYQVMFYMYGFGVVIFWAMLRSRVNWRAALTWRTGEAALLFACGALTFLYDFFYLKSLERIPAVEASMLNYLFPIFIVLFAIPMHGEKMNRYKAASVLMGAAGTALLVTEGQLGSFAFTDLEGDAYAVAAAVSWGLFTNLVKKNRQDLMLSTIAITAVAFALSAGALLLSSRFVLPRSGDLYGVLWLSVSNIVLGFLLYFRALKYASASLVASFTFFTPFVTLLFIVLLLDERLTAIDAAAAALIILSVPLQKLGERARQGVSSLY